jgi:hypothetical protein
MLSLYDYHAQIDEALAINSIETSFSYTLFTDLINEQRALWLRNEYNKNRSVDPYVIQTLSCVELELVDPIQCCVAVPTGCKVLRTKKKIPNTIEFFFTKGITSVGPADIMRPRFLLIDYSRVPYAGTGRTNGKAIYSFIYDSYMYVFSKEPGLALLKYITIRGIFEDPSELGSFLDCSSNQTCWKPSDPYPLNQWMWAYIKQNVIQQLMQKATQIQDDAVNSEDQKADQPIMPPNAKE